MKKTFLAPVAEVIATETIEMIAASTVGISSEQISGTESQVIEAGARTMGSNGASAVSVEALDF